MGYFNLAAAGWLWALPLAVGVPLLAHLHSRRGGTVVLFSATRFVKQAVSEHHRRLRPRHWLLLALRGLALSLIVIAFAQPVWYHTLPPDWKPSTGVVTAFILDRSASMGRTHRGATLFDDARRRLTQALERLDPQHDLATVITVDAAPRALWPQPSANFSGLIQQINQLQPTHERGDLEAALRLAHSQLSDRGRTTSHAPGPRVKRIDIFSDMQQTQAPGKHAKRLMVKGIKTHYHPIGQAGGNLTITTPSMTPTHPVVGQRATVTTKLMYFEPNPSADPVEAQVTLDFEGRTQRRTVTVTPGATRSVAFTLYPTQPGTKPVRLRAQADPHHDAWPLDNETGLFIEVTASRGVALVTASWPDDPHTAAHYFARALEPKLDDPARLGVTVNRWTPDQLGPHLAQRSASNPSGTLPEAVIVVEAGALNPKALEALHRYLIGGGAVLWVIDSAQAAESLHQFDQLNPGHGLSPIVTPGKSAWVGDTSAELGLARFEDPLLGVFQGPARSGWMGLSFGAVLAGSAAPQAQALLSFRDGSPALGYQWVGSGRLAVFAADLAPAYSDLVKGPLFLPLVHELVRGLSPGPPIPTAPHPGTAVRLTLAHRIANPQHVRVIGPEGEPVAFSIAATNQHQTHLQLPRLPHTGLYTAVRQADQTLLHGVFVALDPSESDLRVMQPSGLANSGAGQSAVSLAGVYRSDTNDQGLRPPGLELWPLLVAGSVVLLAIESVAIAFMHQRKPVLQGGPLNHVA